MSEIAFQFLVPFEEGEYLTFYKWLPHKPGETILLERDGLILDLSFPPGIAGSMPPPDDDDLSTVENPSAYGVLATVEVTCWTTELIEFSRRSPQERRDAAYNELRGEFLDRCKEIQSFVLAAINRVIVFARVYKGQFWISELRHHPDDIGGFFAGAKAHVRYGSSHFVPFRLDGPHVVVALHSDPPRHIAREDWPDLLDFLNSDTRPPLVDSLMVSALELLRKGHKRSAILEATTALEISLARFVRRSKDRPLPAEFGGRLEVETLDDLIKKVGFRGAFGLVLPLLLSDDELPSALLLKCREAIDERNRVVHLGKRDVSGRKLVEWLPAIDTCCQVLCGRDDAGELAPLT